MLLGLLVMGVRKSSSHGGGGVRAVSVSPRAGRCGKSGKTLEKFSSGPSGAACYPLAEKVARRFGGVWHVATVVRAVEPEADDKDRRSWFRVVYASDGDSEDLTRREVTEGIAAHKDHVKLEDSRRAPLALPAPVPLAKVAPDELSCALYDRVDPIRVLTEVGQEDAESKRAAKLLLALKPLPTNKALKAPLPKFKPVLPGQPAPSRMRKNHQAMSKPPVDADGNYPCGKGCGRVFGHAPASVAHTKACKYCP